MGAFEGTVQVSVPPAVEPVTLAEAKAQLRITATDEDTLVTGLIQAARESVEDYLGFALVQQTIVYRLDEFPCEDFIRLPRSNLLAVDSLQYVDEDGSTQTWASGNYSVDASAFPGRILLGYGLDWPATRAQRNAVTITYRAGYAGSGDSPPDMTGIPKKFKQAMLLILADLYENREAQGAAELYENKAAKALLSPSRLRSF